MIGIYSFTNKINNKKYIGQSTNISQRYNQHISRMKNGETKFYKALRKYGLKNFDFQIIEECDQEDLSIREQYWIDYYDSINKGYNSCNSDGSCYGELNANAKLTNDLVEYARKKVHLENIAPKRLWLEEFKEIISYDAFWEMLHGYTWKTVDCSMIKPIEQNTKGSLNGRTKLTEEDVLSIRNRIYIANEDWKNVYNDYKSLISIDAFTKMMRGDTWKHVDYSMVHTLKVERAGKPKAKLSIEDVQKIRYLHEKENKTIIELTEYYPNVSKTTIRRVVNYETWKDVEPVSTISEA